MVPSEDAGTRTSGVFAYSNTAAPKTPRVMNGLGTSSGEIG